MDLLRLRCATQGGVFSAEDALDCGYSRRGLDQLVSAGEVTRVVPGAYADSALLQTGSAEQRHACSTRAVLHAYGSAVVASHQSALTLWGLPVFAAPLDRVHLTRLSGRPTRTGRRVTLHRACDVTAVRPVDGVLSVIPALACLGVAPAGIEAVVVAADAALHAGLVTITELRQSLDRLSGQPHSRTARQGVELSDATAESPGESRTRLLLHGIGCTDVEPQVTIRDPDGRFLGRVDFLLAKRVVVEFDGLVKYEGADGRQALVREKQREDALSDAGYQMVRLVWRDLDRPLMVRRRLEAALVRSVGPVPGW